MGHWFILIVVRIENEMFIHRRKHEQDPAFYRTQLIPSQLVSFPPADVISLFECLRLVFFGKYEIFFC